MAVSWKSGNYPQNKYKFNKPQIFSQVTTELRNGKVPYPHRPATGTCCTAEHSSVDTGAVGRGSSFPWNLHPAPIHSSSFSRSLSSFTNHEHTEDEKQALSEPRGLSEAGIVICLSEQWLQYSTLRPENHTSDIISTYVRIWLHSDSWVSVRKLSIPCCKSWLRISYI